MGDNLAARLCLVEETSELETEWPFLRQQLQAEPELWYDFCSLDELESLLYIGFVHLWVVKDGPERLFWFLSETRNGLHEDNLVLSIWWMRGERAVENLPLLIAQVVPVMKAKGFKSIVVSGRKGWERAMAVHGFKHHRTELILHI